MFLHLSVILLTRGGLHRGVCIWGVYIQEGLRRGRGELGRLSPPTSGWFVSYWNAFFLDVNYCMNFSVQPIAKWVYNPLLNFSVNTKTDQIASVNATTLYIQRFGLGNPGSATEIYVLFDTYTLFNFVRYVNLLQIFRSDRAVSN